MNEISGNKGCADEKKEKSDKQKRTIFVFRLYLHQKNREHKDYMLIIYHFIVVLRGIKIGIFSSLIFYIHTRLYWHVIDLLVLVKV